MFDWLTKRVRDAVGRAADRGRAVKTSSRIVEIPVCYDSEFALDIDRVAEHAKVSTPEVVDLHSAAQYRVSCIGFTPGFPFLSGMPKRLATPRRDVPRKEILAGSVGIGGWNLIGRTPLKLFDPTKDPPALLRAGDRVRFRAIKRAEFDSLKR